MIVSILMMDLSIYTKLTNDFFYGREMATASMSVDVKSFMVSYSPLF
jgi:hypothetical protein